MNVPRSALKPVVRSASIGLLGWSLFLTVSAVSRDACAASPTVGMAEASACGVRVSIIDGGTVTVKSSTLAVTLDEVPIAPSISRSGLITGVSVEPSEFLLPGSQHTIAVRFTDTAGNLVSKQQDFFVPFYTLFPASTAVAAYDASSSGFRMRTVWNPGTTRGPGDPDSIANGEAQLAGRYVDAFGVPLMNLADLTGSDKEGYFTVQTVNFQQSGTDIDGHPDNFDSINPPNRPRPNQPIPGIPSGDRDNFSVELLTFLSLGKGCYTLGVNSDDGFVLTLGTSAFGPVLGAFNSGRTPGNSIFEIAVEEDGVYPVRLAWWEDRGSGALELFSISESGERVLVNDRTNPNAIIAHSIGHAPGALLNVGAYQQATGVGDVTKLVARFRDDSTIVNPGSVTLFLDGEPLSVSTNKAQGITSFIFGPTRVLQPGSEHSAILNYSIGGLGNSVALSFRVRAETAGELPGGLAIEIEHFDFGAGKMIPAVNSIPYAGDEYNGLSAVADIDYYRSASILDGDIYRLGESPNVPMEVDLTPNTLDVERPGGWAVSVNHRIGWTAGDWYNFTRSFTNGNYKVYAAQSDGNNAGDPNHLRSRFGIVTSGWGTRNQGIFMIGSYSEPATGDWGNNALVKLKEDGQDTVVHLSGTNTIRVFIDEGDFDWLAFVPTTEPTTPPSVSFVSPEPASVTLAGTISIDLRDLFRDRSILADTIQLFVNGQEVTAATAVRKTAEGANISYSPSTGFTAGTVDYILKYRVSGGEMLSFHTNFVSVGANPFIIEAEDFNYSGGKFQPGASAMPLSAGLYDGFGGVPGIDYHVEGSAIAAGEQVYRRSSNLTVSLADNSNDLARGAFDVLSNYRVTHLNPGDWFNYTRAFPNGRYQVWAALSHGDNGPTSGSLHSVTTNPGQPNQVITALGTFEAPGGTGGWGLNRFVPLRDRNGAPVVTSLTGTQTVRYIAVSGDFDFLAFIPVASPSDPPPALALSASGTAKLRVSWSNGGTLESSPVLGPGAIWQSVGTGGAIEFPTDGRARYFRVKR